MAETFGRLKQRWQDEVDARRARSERLRAMVQTQCRRVFERYGVEKAVLYGSVAEGRAEFRSDIDLLVVPLANEVYWDFMHELEDVLDRPIDLYTDRDDPTWVRRILDRGEVIYGA